MKRFEIGFEDNQHESDILSDIVQICKKLNNVNSNNNNNNINSINNNNIINNNNNMKINDLNKSQINNINLTNYKQLHTNNNNNNNIFNNNKNIECLNKDNFSFINKQRQIISFVNKQKQKYFSQYDPQSIYPPPSIISKQLSQLSYSNSIVNANVYNNNNNIINYNNIKTFVNNNTNCNNNVNINANNTVQNNKQQQNIFKRYEDNKNIKKYQVNIKKIKPNIQIGNNKYINIQQENQILSISKDKINQKINLLIKNHQINQINNKIKQEQITNKQHNKISNMIKQQYQINNKNKQQNKSINKIIKQQESLQKDKQIIKLKSIKRKQSIDSTKYINKNNKKQINMKNIPPPPNHKITDFFNYFQNNQTNSNTQSKYQHNRMNVLEYNIKNNENENKQQDINDINQQKLCQLVIQRINPIPVQQKNPLKQLLLQKLIKKKQSLLKLSLQYSSLQKQQHQLKNQQNLLKQNQKKQLKEQLLQTNQIRLAYNKYKSQIKEHYLNNNKEKLIENFNDKAKMLKQYKDKFMKKSNKKDNINSNYTDEQSLRDNNNNNINNNNIDTNNLNINYNSNNFNNNSLNNLNNNNLNNNMVIKQSQKKIYINQWIGKLDKFKDKVSNDDKYEDKISSLQQLPQQLCKILTQQIPNYIFLSCRPLTSFYSTFSIHCFNLQLLHYQYLTLIFYPKFTQLRQKQFISSQVSTLYKCSIKLYNSTSSYFLQTTMSQSISNGIIFGRQSCEQYENLYDIIKSNKYQGFNEVIVKYIVKTCLLILEEIKVKIGKQVGILPFNFWFNHKYQIKLSDILFNTLYLTKQFKPSLKSNNLYYYIPPINDNIFFPLWSMGILVYYLIYEKYPFQYQIQQQFHKQTFYIYHQLQFPNKPTISQKMKDFITMCLMMKEKDINNVMKHQVFQK